MRTRNPGSRLFSTGASFLLLNVIACGSNMASPERKNHHSTTLEQIAQVAREVTLRDGYHVPLLIVEGNNRQILTHIPHLPSTHEERRQLMYLTGSALAQSRQIADLEQIVFICEGWMSVVDEEHMPLLPPSKDPQRLEVLIISDLKPHSGESRMIAYEMIRDEAQKLIDLTCLDTDMDEQTTAKSPLLSAFAQGFQAELRQLAN